MYMAFTASGKIWSSAKAFGWFNIFGLSFNLNDNMKHNHGQIVETLHLDQAGQNIKIKLLDSKVINVPIQRLQIDEIEDSEKSIGKEKNDHYRAVK